MPKKRALAAGFGTNANAVKYLNQDFETLRAQCLSQGGLFSDPTFPAAPESLGFKELGPSSSKTRGVVWKRPTVSTCEVMLTIVSLYLLMHMICLLLGWLLDHKVIAYYASPCHVAKIRKGLSN